MNDFADVDLRHLFQRILICAVLGCPIDCTIHPQIIFTATRHHVEFLNELLTHSGVTPSVVYGTMDQTARKIHIGKFRAQKTQLLIVTDVAARGIDIPLLDNVINYGEARMFVVGVRHGKVGLFLRCQDLLSRFADAEFASSGRSRSVSLVAKPIIKYENDVQLFASRFS